MDLELVPTEELIRELVSRSTFQGLVLHRPGDFKGQWQDGSNPFRLSFNNLDRGEAQRLMVVASDFIQYGATGGDSLG